MSISKSERRLVWGYMALTVLMLIMLVACSSTPKTPEQIEEQKLEKEWRRGIDKENWAACVVAYSKAGMGTEHVNHTHAKHRRDHWTVIKDDLWRNNCKTALGKKWAEYHYGDKK